MFAAESSWAAGTKQVDAVHGVRFAQIHRSPVSAPLANSSPNACPFNIPRHFTMQTRAAPATSLQAQAHLTSNPSSSFHTRSPWSTGSPSPSSSSMAVRALPDLGTCAPAHCVLLPSRLSEVHALPCGSLLVGCSFTTGPSILTRIDASVVQLGICHLP